MGYIHKFLYPSGRYVATRPETTAAIHISRYMWLYTAHIPLSWHHALSLDGLYCQWSTLHRHAYHQKLWAQIYLFIANKFPLSCGVLSGRNLLQQVSIIISIIIHLGYCATQLIFILYFYLSTYKYKRHRRAICYIDLGFWAWGGELPPENP